jgi:hypothetical protein
MTLSGLLKKYKERHKKLTYAELIKRVTAFNTEHITKNLGSLTVSRYRRAAENAMGKKRVIEFPEWDQIIKPRSYFLKKGFESGEMITDTLRRRLTANLRESLKEAVPGKQFDKNALAKLEGTIRGTLEAYTRTTDGRVPNAHLIAVVEARGAYSEAKREYVQKILEANRDRIKILKRWIHNSRMVKEGRPGHAEMNRKEIPLEEKFRVNQYKKVGRGWVKTGEILMDHPHDPKAPIGEKANCQCDYETRVIIIRGHGLKLDSEGK